MRMPSPPSGAGQTFRMLEVSGEPEAEVRVRVSPHPLSVGLIRGATSRGIASCVSPHLHFACSRSLQLRAPWVVAGHLIAWLYMATVHLAHYPVRPVRVHVLSRRLPALY